MRSTLRLLLLSLGLSAAPAGGAAEPTAPAELRPDILLVSGTLGPLWAEAGEVVHGAPSLRALVPGQRIAVAVTATGPGAEALLRGSTVALRLRFGEEERTIPARGPRVVKRLRARGSALAGVDAAGARGADRQAEALTTGEAVALFDVKWVAPEVKRERTLTVEGEARLARGGRAKLAPGEVPVLPWAEAAGREAFAGAEGASTWMNDYGRRPEPQHLVSVLRLSADLPEFAQREGILAFVSYAVEAGPRGTAAALRSAARREGPSVRRDAAVALRWAGQDTAALRSSLSPALRTEVDVAPARPRRLALHPTFERLQETSHELDLLWARFLATGRPEPVWAVAELLRFRDDLPAIEEYRTAPEEAALRPRVARAVLYRTAGWSLASFVTQETLAADYVDRWKADPAVSRVIREELQRLLVNEAFRRAGEGG